MEKFDEEEKLYSDLGEFVYHAIIKNYLEGEITNKEWLFDYMLRENQEIIDEIKKINAKEALLPQR